MYLQLAENGSDYTPIQTNQGVMLVRNDMLSEMDTTLSAGGALLRKAAPIIGKVAPIALKAAGSFIPGGSIIAGIAGKGIQALTAGAGQAPAVQPPVVTAIGTGLKNLLNKKRSGAAGAGPVAAAIIPAAAAVANPATADALGVETAPAKENFFKKYKTPLLIGGGILAAGTIIYLATRKRKKR